MSIQDNNFSTRCVHQGEKTHTIISWNGSFDPDELDKTRVNCLIVAIDVSSSMNSFLGLQGAHPGNPMESRPAGSLKRIEVVQEALQESLDLIRKLIEDGVQIAFSLLVFNARTTKVYPENPNIPFKRLELSDIASIREMIAKIVAGGSTSISTAITTINELVAAQEALYTQMPNPPRHTYFRVMCSDGDDTCSYRQKGADLVVDHGRSVDITIGVGSACDYSQDVLVGLTKSGDFISAPNKDFFVESFVSRIFAATTFVASDVKLELNPLAEISTTLEQDGTHVLMGDFQSYRQVMFSFTSKQPSTDMTLQFTLTYYHEKTHRNMREHFEVTFRDGEDTPLGNLFGIYAECGQELKNIAEETFDHPEYTTLLEADRLVWLQKYLQTKIKTLESAIEAVRDDPLAKEIRTMAQNTVMELKKVQNAKRSREYMADLYTSSRMVSTGLNTASYSIARTYSSQPTTEPDLICAVCLTEQRQVVAKPCHHFCCCIGCMSRIRKEGMNCPVCRGIITKLYEVMCPTLKDDPLMICKNCHASRIQTFNIPCQHAAFCDKCRREMVKSGLPITCPVEKCGKLVTKTHLFLRV